MIPVYPGFYLDQRDISAALRSNGLDIFKYGLPVLHTENFPISVLPSAEQLFSLQSFLNF